MERDDGHAIPASGVRCDQERPTHHLTSAMSSFRGQIASRTVGASACDVDASPLASVVVTGSGRAAEGSARRGICSSSLVRIERWTEDLTCACQSVASVVSRALVELATSALGSKRLNILGDSETRRRAEEAQARQRREREPTRRRERKRWGRAIDRSIARAIETAADELHLGRLRGPERELELDAGRWGAAGAGAWRRRRASRNLELGRLGLGRRLLLGRLGRLRDLDGLGRLRRLRRAGGGTRGLLGRLADQQRAALSANAPSPPRASWPSPGRTRRSAGTRRWSEESAVGPATPPTHLHVTDRTAVCALSERARASTDALPHLRVVSTLTFFAPGGAWAPSGSVPARACSR